MSGLLEMLVPATLVSTAAIACLALLPDAPPRTRFSLAIAGLAAWLAPWPWIHLPLAIPDGVVVFNLTSGPHSLTAPNAPLYPVYAMALPVLIGLVQLVRDYGAFRATLRDWRARSRSGEMLRAWLPDDLRTTRAEIRIVSGARVAAASGWFRPTIWLGDELGTDADLRVALVHECWHLRRRDPVWVALVAALRRAYWWNPLVTHLADQAVLMTESLCDRRCIATLGRRDYVGRLAAMMLEAGDSASTPSLAPAARRPSLNVRRLKLLDATPRLRPRDYAVLAFFCVAATAAAAAQVVEAPGARPDWSRVSIPATPAGRALAALLGAFNDGDLESVGAYLGAYTPQEVRLDLYDWTSGLELVDIVESEPLSIEYLVKAKEGGARKVGRLEVAASEPIRVMDSELSAVMASGEEE